MKLNRILSALLLTLLCLPAMAQEQISRKLTTAMSSATVQPKIEMNHEKGFEGMILFDCHRDASADGVMQGMGEKLFYSFHKTVCFGSLPGAYYHINVEEHLITEGVSIEEDKFRACEHKYCDMKPLGCQVLDKVYEQQLRGQDPEADEALAKYYIRTDDQKEICGHNCVRYEMPEQKFSFWVAEDMRLNTWFAPFWGINHAVLEFDLSYPTHKGEMATLHMMAVKVVEGEVKEGVEDFRARSEMIPYAEYQDALREFGTRLLK